MKHINFKGLFKKRSFWIIVASLIVSVFIVGLGKYLFDSLESLSVRLLIGSGLFFSTLVGILIRQLYFRNYSSTEMLENARIRSLEIAHRKEVDTLVQKLNSVFDEAHRLLKSSSAYRKRKDALYELPWYLVMGEEFEGKSTLIEATGLEFPLTHQNTYVSNGADKIFEWHFTDEAVLVDINGKFLKNKPGSVESGVWNGFIGLFKKRRWKRPVNGIVLVLSTDTIMNKTKEELEIFSKELRDRFDELSTAFTAKIPIYLFISKCDHISGFNEYFSSIQEHERNEALGLTFEDTGDVNLTMVQSEFDALIKRLDASIMTRMHQKWDRDERNKVLLFTEELTVLFDKMLPFIETGFAQTRYRTPLMLRGIFYTSGHSNLPMRQGNENGMFIAKPFKEMIFTEANMINMDHSRKLRETIREKASLIAAAALVLGIIGLLSWDYRAHASSSDKLQKELQVFSIKRDKSISSTDVDSTLNHLDMLLSIKQEGEREEYRFWNLAFFKADERKIKTNQLFYTALEKEFLPIVADTLETETLKNLNNYDSTWENTKAYLMLNLIDKRDNRFLASWMDSLWAKRYPDNPQLCRKMNLYWAFLLQHGFNSYSINQTTVQTARNSLVGFGKEALLYKQIKDKAMAIHLKDFTFNQAIKENKAIFVGGDYTIPGFYTQKGYQSIFSVDGKALLKEIIRSNWVIGFTTEIKDEDLDAVYAKIQTYYFEDYKKIWMAALTALHLSDNLSNEQISILTTQDSPIIAILKALKQNTNIYSLSELVDHKIAQASHGATVTSTQGLDTGAKSLREFFKPYHFLLTEDYRPGPTLQAEMTRLANTSSETASLSSSDSPSDAFNAILAMANGRGSAISGDVSPLPSPVSGWLPRNSGNNTAKLVAQGKKYIEEQYRIQLYPFYRDKLANKYPFNPNSTTDVALVDFEGFFGSGGLLEQFEHEYIDPFVTMNTTGKGYKTKRFGGSSVTFDATLMDALYYGSDIRRTFFTGRGLGMSLYIKPNLLGKNLASMSLSYDDSSMIYEHGPIKYKKMAWPAETGNTDIKFILTDLNDHSVVTLNAEGQWALFKLMDRMKANASTPDDVIVEYVNQNYKGSYMINGNAAKVFSPNSPIRHFRLPRSI